MKTRIKVVERNNGEIEYYPQIGHWMVFAREWLYLIKDETGSFMSSYCVYPEWMYKFKTLEEAKKHIDDALLYWKKEHREEIANKVKSTKYIKYP